MSLEKIEAIKKISKGASGTQAPQIAEEAAQAVAPPNKDYFEALMKQGRKEIAMIQPDVAPAPKTSLMDEVKSLNTKVDQVTKASPKELIDQADGVIAQIDTLKEKLATPNLDIKGSVQNLLRNKLSHIDDNIRVALSKAGVEYKAPDKTDNTKLNPIERFLGFLTDGQQRLQSLSSEVESMHLNGKEISPANMLAVQIKVGYIQQELEFFTSLLNKALESTKTIMNVQV
jgi:hypothetical protein